MMQRRHVVGTRILLTLAGLALAVLLTLSLDGVSWPPDRAEAQANRAPTLTATEPGFRTIREDAAIGANVGDPIGATDLDSDTLRYRLQSSFGLSDVTTFSIDETTGQLTVARALDYETNRVHTLLVNIKDPTNPGLRRWFGVVIEDVDEAPVVTRTSPTTGQSATDSTALTLGTNTAGGTIAGFSASDPEGDAIIWSLSGSDADDFSITSAGNLSLNQVLDVSNPTDADGDNVYEVTVLASDPASNTSEGHDVTVTATGVLGPRTLAFNEGARKHVGYYTLHGRPANSGNGTWSLSGPQAGQFTIETCRSADNIICTDGDSFHRVRVRFKNVPDHSARSSYRFNVEWRYGTPAKLLGSAPVTVDIRDLDGAPTVKVGDDERPIARVSQREGSGIDQGFEVSEPGKSADDGDFTIVLAGADGHLFKYEHQFGARFQLFSKIVFDHENALDANSNGVYEVLVKVHNGSSTTVREVHVGVGGFLEKPRLHGPSSTKYEVGGTGTVATYIGGDDETGSVTFSVEGTNASLFTIDSSGNLTYQNSPTATGTHNVTIKASAGGESVTQALVVTVVASGTNNAPTAITQSGTYSKDEGAGTIGGAADINTFTTTDADSDTIYWSLSGADAEHFWIGHDGKLRLIKNLDFENPADTGENNQYDLTVTATDGIDSVSKVVSVLVLNVNEHPIVTGDMEVEVADGSTTVATYTANDPETTQTITWSLTGKDASDFSISSSGALTFNNAPDANTKDIYFVVVKASDGSLFDTLPVNVIVTGGNSAPSVSGGPETASFMENATGVIGTYRATDADGDPITWSLSGNDANLFQITGGGVLSFKAPPDFENKRDSGADNVYNVTVNAGDGTGTGTRDVAVTVTDVNELPVVSGPAFSEVNAGATDTGETSLTIATFTVADPEGDTSAVTWSLAGADSGKYAISSSGVLTSIAAPVFEGVDPPEDNVHPLTVRATIAGKTGTLHVAVGIKQQNQAPTIAAATATTGRASVSFAENGTGNVETYIASDPEGDTITWSVTGTDADAFNISGGVLTFKIAPDHETKGSYSITVVATDGVNQDTRAVTVTVTDVNEGPTLTGSTGVNFAENSVTSTVVETFTANDPESDAVSLALSGTDASSFSISASGALTFNTSPDRETKDSYVVTITATSTGGSDSITLTVTITDVDETLSWFTPLLGTRPIQEGRTNISQVRVEDPEGASVTWNLSGTDASSFELGSTSHTNVVQFGFKSAADFETKSSYSVTIEATAGGHTIMQDVTVNVSNVDEPGVVSGVPASPQVNSAVTASLTDPDGSISGLSWKWQTFDGTTATDIASATSATFTPTTSEQGKKLRAVASYTDGHGSGKTASATSTNNVGARANAAPAFTNASESLSIAENAASGTAVGTITASDADSEDATALRYSLESLGTAPFTVNASTGQISTNGALDHETNSSHTFTLKVTDGPGATDTVSVTVNVTDVEETGSVTFSPTAISVNTAVTASVVDGDGGVTSVTWQWQREDGTTFTNIAGETSSSYTTTDDDSGKKLRVVANYTDRRGGGKQATGTTATVGNSAPTMTCSTTSKSVAENQATTETIETYSASDPEGQSITYSVEGTDAAAFSVDTGGTLTWAAAPNFESATDSDGNNVYSVTVAASDGSLKATCTIEVTVTNVDEAGTLTFSPTAPEATRPVSATFDDPDGETSVTYQWSLRTGADVTEITGATSSSYTPSADQIGSFLSLTVSYTDSFGSKTVTGSTNEITAKQNPPPEFTAAALAQTTLTVAENTPSGRNIGSRYTASDAEGEALTYSLNGGTDAEAFSITSNGQLQTKAPLDHETKSSYTVEVNVVDRTANGPSITVTITVTDVDEAPTFSGDAAQSYDETRTDAVATFTADDPETTTAPTWADPTGADASKFNFDKGTGVLTFVNQPDFENPADSGGNNVYNITLGASDGTKSSTYPVTVTVVNVDEVGEITFPNRQPQVAVEFVAEISDPDGTVTNVRWQWSIGTTPATATDISGATKDRYEPVVGDIGETLHVTVTYNDPHGDDKTLTKTVDLTVNPAPPEPFPPEFTDGTSVVREIEENREDNAQVGLPVAATDPNENDTLTYSIDRASEALFSVEASSGQLTAKSAFDYEKRRSYSVRLTVTDGADLTDTITVTINVTDVDEAPTLTMVGGDGSAQATVEYYETRTFAVANFRATDPERETIEYRTDNSDFTVENGALKFVTPPDFETTSTYTVTVTAREVDDSDSQNPGQTSNSITLSITIVDVNEAPKPTAASGTADKTIQENASTTWTFTENDPENFVVAWSVAGTDGRHFKISKGGVLEFKSPPDYESPKDSGRNNVYDITVQAFDGHNTGRLNVTVTVTNVEEAPQIRFSQIRPVVGVRIIATLYDPEVSSPRNLEWDWQGGGATVGVNAGLGGRPSAKSPGFTPTRDGSILQVIATYLDSDGNEQTVNSITAGAEQEIVRPNPADQDPPQTNDAPEFTQDTYSFSVQENAGPGSSVGTVSATDDDTFTFSGHGTIRDQDALHYSLDSASAAVFDIDRRSGAITARAPLDYETKSSYTAKVTVTDSMRETDTATVTITVTDVNEPPEITTSKDVFFVGSGNTSVTTFRATDPDKDEITWSQSDTSTFTIDPATGVLTFNNPPTYDEAGTNSWEITVTATDPDDSGFSDSIQVTVAVTGDPPSAGPSGPPGGGGGGGGFPGGFGPPPEPEPSDEDLEWNITRDIEPLGEDHGSPTGMWGRNNVLWILQNGASGPDFLYAYDLTSGERLTDLGFELDRANRASHGVWSDGEIVWIADAEADKLFAYELDSGERAEDRDFELDESNLEPRGIWSDGETLYVLNAGQRGSLFVYDIATASLLAEYRLHNTINTSPRGIWSDGVTIWTSDEKYSGLVAYRLNEQDAELVRREAEEFEFRTLIASSNTDSRGIWSDGNVMYVVDEEELKVFSYNMLDAIVATLDSISLDGVALKSFSADRLEYAVEVGADTRLLTVEAVATVAGASVMIEPPDGDRDPSNGHTVVASRVETLTVTVTSEDGTRTREYRVRLAEPGELGSDCLDGLTSQRLSRVRFSGGSVEELRDCAAESGVATLFYRAGSRWLIYGAGLPDFLTRGFRARFGLGLPVDTPLVAVRAG